MSRDKIPIVVIRRNLTRRRLKAITSKTLATLPENAGMVMGKENKPKRQPRAHLA